MGQQLPRGTPVEVCHLPRADCGSSANTAEGGDIPSAPMDTSPNGPGKEEVPSSPVEDSLGDHSQDNSGSNQEGTHHMHCGATIVTSSCEQAEDSDKELIGTFVDEPPDN